MLCEKATAQRIKTKKMWTRTSSGVLFIAIKKTSQGLIIYK